MAVERAPAGTSLVDVLDRVLDKGIVIDAYVRVTLVGIDLIGVEARIVVASVDTYLRYSDQIQLAGSATRPTGDDLPGQVERLTAENRRLREQIGTQGLGADLQEDGSD